MHFPSYFLKELAAAAVIAVVVASTAIAIAETATVAAAAHQQKDDDNPPAAVSTKEIVTHNEFLLLKLSSQYMESERKWLQDFGKRTFLVLYLIAIISFFCSHRIFSKPYTCFPSYAVS